MTFRDAISISNSLASSDVLVFHCKVIAVLLRCEIGSVLYREQINSRQADHSHTEIAIESTYRDDRSSESRAATAGRDL